MPVCRERWSSTSGRGAVVALTSTRPSPFKRTVTSADAFGTAARRRTTRTGARIASSVCPRPANSNRARAPFRGQGAGRAARAKRGPTGEVDGPGDLAAVDARDRGLGAGGREGRARETLEEGQRPGGGVRKGRPPVGGGGPRPAGGSALAVPGRAAAARPG